MAEIKSNEECKETEENIIDKSQKQIDDSACDQLEIPPKDDNHVGLLEKDNFEEVLAGPVLIMVHPCESAGTSVPCKTTRPRLSSSSSVCRICHEDDNSENLISPCECMGTLGLVHRSCLEKWLSASNTTECEICKYQFSTMQYPRPIWQWFKSHQGVDFHQGFFGDAICLLILTPLCLASIYLCGMGATMYMRHGLWEAMGLAMLCCFLLATYILWVGVTIRFHLKMLRRWQRMNQLVRLSDAQRLHHPVTRQEGCEVNNNGNLEPTENRSVTSQVAQDLEMNVFV